MSKGSAIQTPVMMRRLGLILGAAVFLIIMLLPEPAGLGREGKIALASAALLALWWMTEALPIPVTSLLPLLLFPLFGVLDMQSAAAPYSDQLVFLFLGGFILALGVERSGLHRRIALHVIRRVGTGQARLVLGFMLATAGLSMWISNTATVMLMLPIAMAVLTRTGGQSEAGMRGFPTALLLGIAYAASIGGTATLIGTPPNIVLAGVMRKLYPSGPEISFVQWMMFGVPLAAVFLPLVWVLLVRVLPSTRVRIIGSSQRAHISVQQELAALGPMQPVERKVLLLFLLTALGWVFRIPIDVGLFRLPGISDVLPQVTDATIAVTSGVLLFFVNRGRGQRLLTWSDAQSGIPWGILLLFGGGFSLAEAMRSSGVTLYLGGLIQGMHAVPTIVVVLAVCLLLTFLTELTSNTATATILVPVMAAAAVALGEHPLLLALPAALNASFAFMLPVATPPNAIVFSTSLVSIRTMALTGFVFNLMGVLLVALLLYTLGFEVFGIAPNTVPVWAR
jgi:solute carrier family 13 (sodium-dependent dicarboxylate transporter), member 2/3/5